MNDTPYPSHWGNPPTIQTGDITPFPCNWGMGSTTKRNWIRGRVKVEGMAPILCAPDQGDVWVVHQKFPEGEDHYFIVWESLEEEDGPRAFEPIYGVCTWFAITETVYRSLVRQSDLWVRDNTKRMKGESKWGT
jgi:hypothetical protein